MAESTFVDGVAALLLLSGLAHILLPRKTDHWMSKLGVVRFVGVCLILLAIACLAWHGWFFRTLFAGLAISGIWRLCFPRQSIRAQQRAYPRWVHGCLLLGGAILVWVFRP